MGPPTPKGGDWDIKSKNLIFLPSQKTMRNYTGSPFTLRSVLTLGANSNDTIISAIATFKSAGVDPCVVALTFDKAGMKTARRPPTIAALMHASRRGSPLPLNRSRTDRLQVSLKRVAIARP